MTEKPWAEAEAYYTEYSHVLYGNLLETGFQNCVYTRTKTENKTETKTKFQMLHTQ